MMVLSMVTFLSSWGCYSVKHLSPQGFLLRLTAVLMSVPGVLANGEISAVMFPKLVLCETVSVS